jgi:hypothetical protein
MSRRSNSIVVLVLALLAAAPAATAGWIAMGHSEPDTPRSQADGWMFTSPDTTPLDPNGNGVHQVYFAGFFGACEVAECTSVSPNVGALQTQMHTEQSITFAMLGVWKDCNADGYVGLGDQGLWEYRSELLLASSAGARICPVQSGSSAGLIVHNDGTWVHEFVPIQWSNWQKPLDPNPYNIKDNGSRVWVDAGLPETDLGSSGGNPSGCWLSPQPRGTWHNVGGLLYYADCNTGYTVTDTFDQAGADIKTPAVTVSDPLSGQPLLPVPSFDTGIGLDHLGLGQVSFSDDPRYQGASKSILNVKPWGEESDPSYAQAWDCSQTQPAHEQVASTPANVSAPSSNPAPNTAGSPAGTVNATASGTDQCNRRTTSGGGAGGHDATMPYEAGCFGGVGYPCEGDLVNTHANPGKTSTDVLGPRIQARPNGPASLVDKHTPPDYGVHYTTNDFWDDNTDVIGDLATFRYTTFYAYVSPAAVATYHLTLPKGSTTGVYGAEACGGATSGVVKGWNCAASAWWKSPLGDDIAPRSYVLGPDHSITAPCTAGGSSTDASTRGCISFAAAPGSPYNLRDISCMDEATGAQRSNGLTYDDVQFARQSLEYSTAQGAWNTAYPLASQVDPALSTANPLVSDPGPTNPNAC